ncbi:DUF1553 domain-containing protein [Neorhodopirellula lusitana]|uniref:DUF1553 domain-containing protein n=1 Tax=Neorhodopirellula lusitana TaxID=445327 RepID=UPI0038512FD2
MNPLRCRRVSVGLLCLPIFLALSVIAASTTVSGSEVARWDFDSEAAMPLELHGNVHRDQAGPRPPEFPDQTSDNTALRFEGNGFLTMADSGPSSEFDFDNGDEITLEAWVRVDQAKGTSPMYVISKGRTGTATFARDNQNWALRVVSLGDSIRASFLFATPIQPKAARADSHWHRWTTEKGFLARSGWHHIAVAYRFGEPESIHGWIDGVATNGKWDMGGPTRDKPVVDDDAIWIGSASRGSAGNSYRGWMDGLAVHRSILTAKTIAARFNRQGGPRVMGPQPESMPELGMISDGRVLVTFSEGMPHASRWLLEHESWPKETGRLDSNAFLLPRIPVRFDDWGIRIGWKPPLLVRMAGDVELPPGKHRFLVRTRSLSRLWIDGDLVARTKPVRRRSGNLEPVVPIPEPLVSGARLLPFPQQEEFVEYEVESKTDAGANNGSPDGPIKTRVVLEFMVGGNNNRMQSGEVCVAMQPHGTGPLLVLKPDSSSPLPLTDAAIEPALREFEASMVAFEDSVRRDAAASQDAFWQGRHQIAREATRNIEQPILDPGTHSIDDFVNQKIEQALSKSERFEKNDSMHFNQSVLPILRDQCFRCHGEKAQGGLRLNSRDAALASGESELPAIVPGSPDQSELIVRIRDHDMPPTDDGLTGEQIAILEGWVKDGAIWPTPPVEPESVAMAPVVDDASFLRRVYLDTVGVGPSEGHVRQFLASRDPDKRVKLIDELLQDDRYADHWISFWMDVLAENPGLLNPSLNSTGPFRWFLYDSLRDGKPLDRMVTELILMRGSPHDGGSAGFALAGENDSPMAAKGHILASAFLGIELQCARCHDSPFHSTSQEDLYSLAAMLNRKQLAPPKTSRVPDAFFEGIGRESLISVTLKPGVQVQPKWPFASFTGIEDGPHLDPLVQNPKDSRERLAALITAPHNERFPRVIVNHLWNRLIGAGIVQPVNDWEGKTPSHPELLDWLAMELVSHDYDLKHVLRQIMTSQLYQRQAVGRNQQAVAEQRFFNAPDPRRLAAEQIVDSLFVSTGLEMDTEEMTFVHDGSASSKTRLTLGFPKRSWMFTSLSNERDRPSLAMPRAQPIADVLEAFGWSGTRQQPIAERESDPNLLQPGILANGTLSMSLTRASYQSPLAQLAVDASSPEELLDSLFLRFLSRYPTKAETQSLVPALTNGFESRVLPADQVRVPVADSPLPLSTWTNHLLPEANDIQEEWQERVRRGPAADPRLQPHWREVYEDVVWSLVNDREFVWVP